MHCFEICLGDISPLFCYLYLMITKDKIEGLIGNIIKDKNLFVVSLDISSSNVIRLLIDSMYGINISECVQLSRTIENGLNRSDEDFEIEVSSPGLGMPFRVREQYIKNIGRDIEVVTKEGQIFQGLLTGVDELAFSLEREQKIKVEGRKKKQLIKEVLNFNFENVSKVRNVLK